MFSHDASAGVFENVTDALSKNPKDENAKLFSILDQLENFRTCEGAFHFKLCYPGLIHSPTGSSCNEWAQSSNPVYEKKVTGLRLLKIAFPTGSSGGTRHTWAGLKYTGKYEVASEGGYFVIGSRIAYQGKIKGPYATPRFNQDLEWVKKAELYVKYVR